MTSRPVALIAALIAAGVATPQLALSRSPPEPGAKPARQCFWTKQVTSFAARDGKIVTVRVGVRDVYELEMFSHCQEVNWAENIALVSGSSSTICTGMDAEIVAPSPIGPQRCAVRAVRKLTPAEVEALPPRARP